MCGFACLWQHDDQDLAKRMIEKIEHRGPDETQIYSSKNVPAIMAHCRLSIIGPSDGSQPIYEGDNILVANGEIYNYSDLRAILGESAFETRSDSETILHLFRSNQLRWITKLDGMFAFVLATPDRVIAARDPLGIKPLYVGKIGDGLAFCSELKAFDGEPVSEIQAIGPGELFDSLDGNRRWYRIAHGAADVEADFDLEAVSSELRLTLEDAVRKWMVADVEVGSFLSGGLDSSIIAAIAAKSTPRQLKTFSVGREGSPDIEAGAKVAEHIGSDHYQLTFSPEDIIEALPHVIYHLESCDVDLVRSAIPTHFATKLARRHVKAVLTGEGADELFAGYTYHHAYAQHPRELADELTRSLTTMHNINLQRVDRITMSQGLEARTPFLDRDLIDFAQTIPASVKMRLDPEKQTTIEKWILRRSCQDLLPHELVWREKAQFDEGTGTVDTLAKALRKLAGTNADVDRDSEAKIYRDILCQQFTNPEMILENAGRWEHDRVAMKSR